MSITPDNCPVCGSSNFVEVAVDEVKQQFSGGKALVGGALFGPIGLAAGLFGKKNVYITKYCKNCGFSHAYKI